MTLPAFLLDVETGETLARFGMEHAPGEYRPERWGLARTYVVPAYGPGGHSWPAWAGALGLLLAVFALLGSHL